MTTSSGSTHYWVDTDIKHIKRCLSCMLYRQEIENKNASRDASGDKTYYYFYKLEM